MVLITVVSMMVVRVKVRVMVRVRFLLITLICSEVDMFRIDVRSRV